MEPSLETIAVAYHPVRWAVYNGMKLVLLTYDRKTAEKYFNILTRLDDCRGFFINILRHDK
jgi:hypothetical protein